MLYVPVGRPGSLTETYLIFENRAEFDAAASFAPKLDVLPSASPGEASAGQAGRSAGLSMFMEILESGVVVEDSLVLACERKLASLCEGGGLSPVDRWAAGILAGRLAASYRYDHVAAKAHYELAEKAVPQGSIEAMTCQWWKADALVEQGKPAEASVVLDGIISSFGEKYRDAHIVRRAKDTLEQQRKR